MEQTFESHQKSKDIILNSALKLFSEKGYEGVSVKEISLTANVNISAISYHFGGKLNLYNKCLENYVLKKQQFLKKNILKFESFEELQIRLEFFLDELIQIDMSSSESAKIFRRDSELRNSPIVELFKKTALDTYNQVYKCFSNAQKKGFIKNSLNAQDLTTLLLGGTYLAIRNDELRKEILNETLNNSSVRSDFIKNIIKITIIRPLSV